MAPVVQGAEPIDPTVTPVAAAWASYQDNCVEPDTPAADRMAQRRAFYCGAHSLLTLLQYIGALPERDKAELMTAIDSELAIYWSTTGADTREWL